MNIKPKVLSKLIFQLNSKSNKIQWNINYIQWRSNNKNSYKSDNKLLNKMINILNKWDKRRKKIIKLNPFSNESVI